MQAHLNSHMMSNFNTDGRTYERDEDGPQVGDQLQAVTHGRVSAEAGPRLIGELPTPGQLWPTERHPVIRSGARDEITSHVRAAVVASPGLTSVTL